MSECNCDSDQYIEHMKQMVHIRHHCCHHYHLVICPTILPRFIFQGKVYLGTTLTNQNAIQEEIKGRSRSGNACYYSVQNLLSSRLLSRNLKIKIYGTIILPVVLYGCETWSLTLREERRLRVFENRVLGEYLNLGGTR